MVIKKKKSLKRTIFLLIVLAIIVIALVKLTVLKDIALFPYQKDEPPSGDTFIAALSAQKIFKIDDQLFKDQKFLELNQFSGVILKDNEQGTRKPFK